MQARFVYFDAVGTLIHPQPPVAEVYERVGRRFGARLTTDQVRERFQAALRIQEQEDIRLEYRTSEERERQRWRSIVGHVFEGFSLVDPILDELWRHFGRPDAWACYPDVAPCLEGLAARGLGLGIASNFDERLYHLAAGLPALFRCRVVAISSTLGWRKPAQGFFAAAMKLAQVAANEILLVGDSPDNDQEGAAAAGWQAILLDRGAGCAAKGRLQTLYDLPHLLERFEDRP